MDRTALKAARTEFDRAFQNIDELASADHYAEVARHWAAFLVNAGRVFTKLEQASKITAKIRAWWGKKVNERRSEELLRYVWHARNADEHGIRPVTDLHPGSIREVSPTNEEAEKLRRQMQNQPLPYAPIALLEIVNPHVKLVSVYDRGVRFDPPNTFRGAPISSPHPHNVGLLALSYIEEMLKEAEALV